MRFNALPYAKIGDRQTRKVFCWFPVRLPNEVVWLETIEVTEEYDCGMDDHACRVSSFWKIVSYKILEET